jgi:integrase/recombinase XerC
MTAATPDASRQAVVEAALVPLERMGLTPADLAAVPQPRTRVPTFAEYVPVMSTAVSAGTRRAYGSYWNRTIEHWGGRRLDEPTPSEIRQLMAYVKAHVVTRRNARGGRSAEEHLVAALRCLYRRAVDDGLPPAVTHRPIPTSSAPLPGPSLKLGASESDPVVTRAPAVASKAIYNPAVIGSYEIVRAEDKVSVLSGAL